VWSIWHSNFAASAAKQGFTFDFTFSSWTCCWRLASSPSSSARRCGHSVEPCAPRLNKIIIILALALMVCVGLIVFEEIAKLPSRDDTR
jgi:hypothetical protein